jgi:hypothetical protein
MRILIVPLLVLFAGTVSAADPVYKWVDENGVVHYTDKPPSDNAKPAKLPPLHTYKSGTNPNLSKFDKGAQGGKATGAAQIELVTPAQDETFRGGERAVPVAVVVTPQLKEGQRLIYLLDGTPQATPTTNTSFAFTEVNRGSHTAAVTLVDEAGNTLATSKTVTFHMKPAITGQAQKLQKQSAPPKP